MVGIFFGCYRVIFYLCNELKNITNMATISFRLSSKIDDVSKRSEVLIRFRGGRGIDFFVNSGCYVLPKHFRYFVNRDAVKKEGVSIPPKVELVTMDEALKKGYPICSKGEVIITERIQTEETKFDNKQKEKLSKLSKQIIESFESADKESLDANWLKLVIDKFHHPEKYLPKKDIEKKKSFAELTEEFLVKKHYTIQREKNFRVMFRTLFRFAAYTRIKLDIDKLDRNDIENFSCYLRDEKDLADEHPNIFKKIVDKYPIQIGTKHKSPKFVNRGNNCIVQLLKLFKSFVSWCIDSGKTTNNPFMGFRVGTEKYGTPFYLTKEERNRVAECNLRRHPFLEIQRDIFVFQCLIGCRVSDLIQLTPKHITKGVLEYVPKKTKDKNTPVKARIPLSKKALALVKKYKGIDEQGRLFPFISSQKYNEDIKLILHGAGIKRIVSVTNPKTGEIELHPIWAVASSHMARRTFVGTTYKLVKDPSLIGSMSGHVEGSRAFARYRDIDDEDRKEVIALID